MGNAIIKENNALLDFPRGRVYLGKDPNSLIANGLMEGKWVKTPLKWTQFPMILIMTDFGPKWVFIDTGTAYNTLMSFM